MKFTNDRILKLVRHYRKISLLGEVRGVLSWDLEVNLPEKGADGRGVQSAYLAGLAVDLWLDRDFRRDLEYLLEHGRGLGREERAVLRNLERGSKYYWRVPKELVEEESKTTSEAFVAWRKARENDNFGVFLPYLKKILELQRRVAGHLGYEKNPYQALVELYEPEARVEWYEKIFEGLRVELVSLLGKIKKSKKYREEKSEKGGDYPRQDQEQVAKFVLKRMGYDFGAGRMDVAPHPFTTELGRFDVRVTNRYNETDFRDSLTAVMHEGGHALYEQGVNEDLEGTALGGGVSLGIHESQSRFWENQVGRNPAFIRFLTPVLQAFYSKELGAKDWQFVSECLNQVRPSLIRVEADEVTYNLHIMLRFELENRLLKSSLRVRDLPEAWRAGMKKYLGVVPETEREGVLQDVHWAHGSFGYFPTYTLGNLYAAQFASKMQEEVNLEKCLEVGNLGEILAWQREKIHQWGSLYWPQELIKRVTGEELNSKYFLAYLKEKYGRIYSLKK